MTEVLVLSPIKTSRDDSSDTFSSSDLLPDEVERLFDRSSFSIHSELSRSLSNYSSPSPVHDADGLLRGFNDLMLGNGGKSEANVEAGDQTGLPASKSLYIMPSHVPTQQDASSALTSISGMTFSNPFTLPDSPPLPAVARSQHGKVKPAGMRRRRSSKYLTTTDIPPVPDIPKTFLTASSGTTKINQTSASRRSCSNIGETLLNFDQGTDSRLSALEEGTEKRFPPEDTGSDVLPFKRVQPSAYSDVRSAELGQAQEDPGVVDRTMPVIRPHSPVAFVRRHSSVQVGDTELGLERAKKMHCSKPPGLLLSARAQTSDSENFFVFQRVPERTQSSRGPQLKSDENLGRRSSIWSKIFGSRSNSPDARLDAPSLNRVPSHGRKLQRKVRSKPRDDINADGRLAVTSSRTTIDPHFH